MMRCMCTYDEKKGRTNTATASISRENGSVGWIDHVPPSPTLVFGLSMTKNLSSPFRKKNSSPPPPLLSSLPQISRFFVPPLMSSLSLLRNHFLLWKVGNKNKAKFCCCSTTTTTNYCFFHHHHQTKKLQCYFSATIAIKLPFLPIEMGNLSSSSYFAYGTTATATDITAATTTTIDATTTNQNEQQQTTTSVMTTINGTGGTEPTATTQLDAGAADQQAQQPMTTTTDGATTVTVTTTNGMTGTTTTTQLDAGADQQQSPPQLKIVRKDDISLPSPPPQAAIATDEVAPPPPSLSSWLFLSTTTAPLPPPPSPPKETTTPIVGNVLPLLANGKYEVGCADIMISDPFSYSAAVSSPCAASCAEGDKQQRPVGVFARIFYPASPSSSSSASSLNGSSAPSSSTTAPAPSPKQFMRWRPDTEYTQGLANYQGMSVAKINIFLDWFVGDKKTPVRWHAPIFPGEQRFPLIIFSHGISGNRFVYTTVCASLASHGYVVAALEHRDGSCCWTYTLEPVPQPMPLPTPSSATEEQKLQNGGANSAKPPQQQPTIPPRTMTPPPTHVKKPIEMRILPHDETEYETRIGQVKKRVDETVQMRRLFVEMDQNGLKDEGENGTFDGQQQHHRIVDGQTFDWSQFKCRFALDRCVCMGHSFGAASALTACAEHPSMFHACVLLDAWLYPVERRMFPTIGQPVLMLNASKWQWARNVRRMHRLLATTASLTDTTKANDGGATATTAPAQDGVGNNTKATTTTTNASAAFTNTDTRMMFTIKDIVHQSFSDFGFLVPGRVARYLAIQGDLDPMLTGTAIMEMMLDFLELQFQQQQKRREERGEEQQQDDDDKDEEEKEEKGTEEREGDEQRQRKDNNGEEAKDMVKSNASSALDHLRRLVADKYATFVLEGTDIPKEKLDEVASFVEAEHLELVLEEERKVANDSAIDTPTTEEKNETQTEKEEEQTEKEEEQMEEEEEQGM